MIENAGISPLITLAGIGLLAALAAMGSLACQVACKIFPVEGERLRLVTDTNGWQPEAGWKVISLVDAREVGWEVE